MKKGFTLAEVLVTMGVIGVIAAVTMPALRNDIWESQRGPLLKTAFEKVSNAFSLATYELGLPSSEDGSMLDKDCETLGAYMVGDDDFSSAKLRIVRTCKGEGNGHSNCNFTYNSSTGFYNLKNSKAYFMAEGPILINKDSSDTKFNTKLFVIDTNGTKGPNKWGQDLFVFETIQKGMNLVLECVG